MIRVQGTMNTFYLIDEDVRDKAVNSKILCLDGTDGVLYASPSQEGLAKMHIYNRDGSEANMCANGLRCFGRYILDKYQVDDGLIETKRQTYYLSKVEDFYGLTGIRIGLDQVKRESHLDHDLLEVDLNLKGYSVSNFHLVSQTQELIDHESLSELGAVCQDMYEGGINLNLYRVLGPGIVYVRTYERGVGLTASCGTGMTASCLDYALGHDFLGKEILVYNDGGLVTCQIQRQGMNFKADFTGNATYMTGSASDQEAYESFYSLSREHLKALNIQDL